MPKKAMNRTTAVNTEAVETPVGEEKKVEHTKRVFNADDEILCRSVTDGKLFVDGLKTGMKYVFPDYNDEAEIEYRDLVALIRARDKSVFKPRFIVEDQDFINEYPTLRKFYDEHYSVMNLKDILTHPDYQMKQEIANLPQSAIDSLKTMAVSQIVSGEIDSVRKIRALDEAFGTNLSLFNELLAN